MLEHTDPQLQIAVCDDDSIDRQQAADLTREIMVAEGLACDLSGYESATALLTAIQDGAQFHILLLDVMMDGLDGMELAAALRKLGDSTAIIFISSNREMALRGYEVSAARYLAKPLREDQLREALLYCYKTFCEKKEILLPTEKGQSKLAPSDIIYVESWERGSRLQLTSGPIETSVRISELASMLPERSFTLCHRTILVNLAFVKHLRSYEIELADGRTLPVSKHRVFDLKKRLLGYMQG
ncbi:LytTR family DNA-binding domain-containing protein [Oscillospiraceae bacterium 50-16]